MVRIPVLCAALLGCVCATSSLQPDAQCDEEPEEFSTLQIGSRGLLNVVHTDQQGAQTVDVVQGDQTASNRNTEDQERPLWQANPTNLPGEGFFRIQQIEDRRRLGGGPGEDWGHLDAFHAGNAVTRRFQDNPSQWWKLSIVAAAQEKDTYFVQQVGGNDGRQSPFILDSRSDSKGAREDYRVFTQSEKIAWIDFQSQSWVFRIAAKKSGEGNVYSIKQASSGRYLDAHLFPAQDGQVVTREKQVDESQRVECQQAGGRSCDSLSSFDDSQRWIVTRLSQDEARRAATCLEECQGNNVADGGGGSSAGTCVNTCQ